MKGQRFKHVTAHNSRWVFQLRVLGFPLYPNEHWDTEEDAACAADTAKHYFRVCYHIDLPRSLDPEHHAVLSNRLSVDLSDRRSVEKSLSPGVASFLLQHRDVLDRHAETNRPERKPWEILRADPSFTSNPRLREWVRACEVAELDTMAFASINGEYLLTLLTGLVGRFEDCLGPLRKAVKMHDNANDGSVKLDDRKKILMALLSHLETDLEYISALPGSFRDEESAVKLALQTLEASRPPLI